MKYDKFSRRMFLHGMGKATLAIPLLPSLLPRESWALTAPSVRYIQLITNTGVIPTSFFPASTGMQDVGNGVMAKKLSTIAGNMSFILDAPLDAFRNKMTIIKGLDCLDYSAHNQTIPTSASGASGNLVVGNFPYSVDSVIASSGKIYPTTVGIHPQVCVSSGNNWYGTYSFNTINGKKAFADLVTGYPSPATNTLLALFNFGAQASTAGLQLQTMLTGAMNDVYGDFKSVRDSVRISATDKSRIDNFMARITDVIKALSSNSGNNCAKPVLGGTDNQHDAISILVAGLACGLTKVVSYALPVSGGGDDPMHAAAHNLDNSIHSPGMRDRVTPYVAYFLQQLDSVTDINGTLLDNSIFYYGNEFGSLRVGSAHVTTGMPVVIAGSAAGRLNTGYFIDYGTKAQFGYYNNLLVTFFNALGLSSSDYERNGQAGFGSYTLNTAVTADQRRTPLPFFYKGPVLG